MKNKALILGLTAFFVAFPMRMLLMFLVMKLGFDIPFTALYIGSVAASFVVALKLAPLMSGDDEPGDILTNLLFVSAAFYLFIELLLGFQVSLGHGKFARFIDKTHDWALVMSTLLALRCLSRRWMLFVGLWVFALQFQAGALLGPLLMRVPDWIPFIITWLVAILFGRALSFGDDSPADRATGTGYLWLFAAAALLAGGISDGVYLPYWTYKAFWVLYLLSFILLVHNVRPDDPDHKSSALGPSVMLSVQVFIALFVVVAGVFKMSALVLSKMSFTAMESRWWLPALICAGIAIAIMFALGLGSRMRDDGPGRGALLWGVIFFVLAVLAGNSIFGAGQDGGQILSLISFVYAMYIMVPLAVLGTLLLSWGLLRVLFTLDAPKN